MNNRRRASLREAIKLLNQARGIVKDVKKEEENSIKSFPENMQYGDKCQKMEDTVEQLDDAEDNILTTIDIISDVL